MVVVVHTLKSAAEEHCKKVAEKMSEVAEVRFYTRFECNSSSFPLVSSVVLPVVIFFFQIILDGIEVPDCSDLEFLKTDCPNLVTLSLNNCNVKNLGDFPAGLKIERFGKFHTRNEYISTSSLLVSSVFPHLLNPFRVYFSQARTRRE